MNIEHCITLEILELGHSFPFSWKEIMFKYGSFLLFETLEQLLTLLQIELFNRASKPQIKLCHVLHIITNGVYATMHFDFLNSQLFG